MVVLVHLLAGGCYTRRIRNFPAWLCPGISPPSRYMSMNKRQATPLSTTDQINSRSLVFNLYGFFTWQCKRNGVIKTSNPVFMHWVDLNFLAPHFNFIIRELQTCHFHNGCTCCFGKFTLLNYGTVVLNIFQVLKSSDKLWTTINLQISCVCFRWQPWGDVST